MLFSVADEVSSMPKTIFWHHSRQRLRSDRTHEWKKEEKKTHEFIYRKSNYISIGKHTCFSFIRRRITFISVYRQKRIIDLRVVSFFSLAFRKSDTISYDVEAWECVKGQAYAIYALNAHEWVKYLALASIVNFLSWTKLYGVSFFVLSLDDDDERRTSKCSRAKYIVSLTRFWA